MMLKAEWAPYRLHFNFEARTSRQVMTVKDTYFVRLYDTSAPGRSAVGECALFRGLSADDRPDYEAVLSEACRNPHEALHSPYSSIRFGFECAMARLNRAADTGNPWLGGRTGIPINGLVWMGDKETMRSRIRQKLDAGFSIIKLKIGGINFDDELDLLREVRRNFGPDTLEVRLDANGAFTADNAMEHLGRLAAFHIHSIEQPVKAGQPALMAEICACSPIAVGLDEELIGMRTEAEASQLLADIRPAYIILKPSLCGGLRATDSYIAAARAMGIGWWVTSALESNIGLADIATHLTENYTIDMPQGLGTGQLYTDNIASPLEMRGPQLYYNPEKTWGNIDNLPWR